ncbi:MAG: methyltransferase domain-containing protein [Planctomycetes bacterium]|nr:methyltransferase domain-containing protein [Planctomycetota bacterium]
MTTPLLPVIANSFPSDPERARAIPRVALELWSCARCGHLFNAAFDPALPVYDQGYETSLHNSAHFQAWAEKLASRLSALLPAHGGTVVELGCGRGEFLALFARDDRRCLGFDRSYDGRLATRAGLSIEARDYDPTRHGPLDAELVACRHVLEHLPAPASHMAALRAASAPRGTVYVEVPNGLWTMRDGGIWDLVHEHCGYFTPRSLASLARRTGFAVRSLEPDYGGQFLGAELALDPRADRATAPAVDPTLAARFATSLRTHLADWNERLAHELDADRRIAIWGAGTKGVTFLNALPRGSEIALVVDRNPFKRGRFVPGTAQRIVAPQDLVSQPPDLVLVMNPLYRAEIAAELVGLGIRCDVAVV